MRGGTAHLPHGACHCRLWCAWLRKPVSSVAVLAAAQSRPERCARCSSSPSSRHVLMPSLAPPPGSALMPSLCTQLLLPQRGAAVAQVPSVPEGARRQRGGGHGSGGAARAAEGGKLLICTAWTGGWVPLQSMQCRAACRCPSAVDRAAPLHSPRQNGAALMTHARGAASGAVQQHSVRC